ncbi:galanin receptor type 2-like [Strongylocentrotus purpuratus]|uniref:G-protein coupled receptors family 1 profile domain-containing protein n=1 Tax=Strongylocentrotus purpuratus TaxID=7668 RepID=A0A7M7PSW3_STRPU|nr:galanin receptor type 2-like [Strongylocentrotus purpuratus]
MKKLVKQSAARIVLRITLLVLVIVANSSEHTTSETPLIQPSDSEGLSETPQTLERSSVNILPTSSAVATETNTEASSQPSKTSDVMHTGASSSDGSDQLQTIHEFVSEFTNVTIVQPSTESVARLDTTIWVWRFSWTWVTILQLIISLIGILGNLLVVVVMRVRRSTTNSTDIFVGALAISDLLTSLFNIPIPRALQVPDNILGACYCRLVNTSCLIWICVVSSSYILVGASFERLASVVYPLRIKDIFTNRRVYIFIIVVWLFSFVSCSYYLLSFLFQGDLLSRIYCVPTDSDTSLLRIINSFNFAIRLMVPTVLMMVSQTAMAILLHLQSIRLRQAMSCGSKQSYHILARNRVIKIMLVVVIIFILSWSPSQIAFVVVSFRGTAKAYVSSSVRQILNLITFINSSINPFIYAAHYPKFRSAIKEICLGKTQKNVPLFGMETIRTPNHELSTDGHA